MTASGIPPYVQLAHTLVEFKDSAKSEIEKLQEAVEAIPGGDVLLEHLAINGAVPTTRQHVQTLVEDMKESILRAISIQQDRFPSVTGDSEELCYQPLEGVYSTTTDSAGFKNNIYSWGRKSFTMFLKTLCFNLVTHTSNLWSLWLMGSDYYIVVNILLYLTYSTKYLEI